MEKILEGFIERMREASNDTERERLMADLAYAIHMATKMQIVGIMNDHISEMHYDVMEDIWKS